VARPIACNRKGGAALGRLWLNLSWEILILERTSGQPVFRSSLCQKLRRMSAEIVQSERRNQEMQIWKIFIALRTVFLLKTNEAVERSERPNPEPNDLNCLI
jgi:hypothetical protein